MKLAVLSFGAALLVGCGMSEDPRPATFEVVTLEILAPSCGQVQCHSTSTKTRDYAFDTLPSARLTLRQLVGPTAEQSELISVMRSNGGRRMPPDYPLPEVDIQLIETWIDAGADGL